MSDPSLPPHAPARPSDEPHPSLLAFLPPPRTLPSNAPAPPGSDAPTAPAQDPCTLADLLARIASSSTLTPPPSEWLARLTAYPFARCTPDEADEVSRAEQADEVRLLQNETWMGEREGWEGKGPVVLHIVARQLTLPTARENETLLLDAVARLTTHADPHMFTQYLDKVTHVISSLMQLGDDAASCQAIAAVACGALGPASNYGKTLTPLHAVVVEYCLRNNAIESAAVLIATHRFREVHPATAYLDHLRYHYLAGLVKLATREWVQARELFEIVVCAPGSAVSAVQVAAYKKLVLVHVLLTGKSYSTPRVATQPMQRAISSHCKAYTDLVSAVAHLADSGVHEAVSGAGETWQADGNAGLLTVVLGTLPERKLLKLRSVYLRVSLADVAGRISAPGQPQASEQAAAELVDRMLAEGKLSGSITPASERAPAYLTFSEEPTTYTDSAILQQLVALAAAAEQEAAVFAEHDQRLMMQPKWIKHGVREKAKEPPAVPSDAGPPVGRSSGMRVGADWTDAGF